MLIKTPNGWVSMGVNAIPAPPVVKTKNPFRCWQDSGAPSLEAWLRR